MRDIGDGTYEVMVIEAAEIADNTLALDLVITAGAVRGEIVHVTARGLDVTWTDVLGRPATLTVSAGSPHIALE
jgi:hypothetical protein